MGSAPTLANHVGEHAPHRPAREHEEHGAEREAERAHPPPLPPQRDHDHRAGGRERPVWRSSNERPRPTYGCTTSTAARNATVATSATERRDEGSRLRARTEQHVGDHRTGGADRHVGQVLERVPRAPELGQRQEEQDDDRAEEEEAARRGATRMGTEATARRSRRRGGPRRRRRRRTCPSGGICASPRRRMRSQRRLCSLTPERARHASAIPRSPSVGRSSNRCIDASGIPYRRSRSPGAGPVGRWQNAQFASRYARARAATGPDGSVGAAQRVVALGRADVRSNRPTWFHARSWLSSASG